MNPPTSEETNKILFVNLVMMLGSSAMQHLGKLMDPATQRTQVNLEAAQASIDMLTMLEAKTRGNLDADEARVLKDTLSALQLNYVETANAQPPAGAEPEKKPEGETSAGKDTASAPPADGKEPKFRKSYG